MTNPAPSSSPSPSTGLTPLQKIAATSALVAAASASLGAGLTRAIDSGAALHFRPCGNLEEISRIRGLKIHTAQLAGDSIFVVPILIDSTGTPALDTAHRQVLTDSVLAVVCTVPPTPTPSVP